MQHAHTLNMFASPFHHVNMHECVRCAYIQRIFTQDLELFLIIMPECVLRSRPHAHPSPPPWWERTSAPPSPPPMCVCCAALHMMCSARLVCERSRLHALHVRVAAEPTPNRKLCVNARLASGLAWLLKTMSRVPVCCGRHACVLSYHHA